MRDKSWGESIYEKEKAKLNDDVPGDGELSDGIVPIDWHTFFAADHDMEWLVRDVWPVGRQVHVHAKKKTGKSLLSLWIALRLSQGFDPFTNDPQPPVIVTYMDKEMSGDDLMERLTEMGETEETLTNLRYYLFPPLPYLDTETGGRKLLEVVKREGSTVVVLDTMSRMVEGDENSNDTYIRFFRYCGMLLKANGIALWRLDHEGHESGRSRGASAKADDVDIVYQLAEKDGGLTLVRKASRLLWIRETINIKSKAEPLSFRSSDTGMFLAGTKEKALELDAAGCETNVTNRKARKMLVEHGYTVGNSRVLSDAIRYRKQTMPGISGEVEQ